MNPELRKALAFFAAAGALALLAGVYGTRLLGLAAGPGAVLIKTLEDTETGSFQLEVPGTAVPLKADQHHFDRLLVDAAPTGDRAVARATLDFDGTLGETKVSSLGVEEVPFVRAGRAWQPVRNLAPRLTAIVSALEARRRALESGSRTALETLVRGNEAALRTDAELNRLLGVGKRRYQARRWLIRSEKEQVLVTEEYRLQGETPDRPVDDEGTRRLVLQESDGEFFFAAGLM